MTTKPPVITVTIHIPPHHYSKKRITLLVWNEKERGKKDLFLSACEDRLVRMFSYTSTMRKQDIMLTSTDRLTTLITVYVYLLLQITVFTVDGEIIDQVKLNGRPVSASFIGGDEGPVGVCVNMENKSLIVYRFDGMLR